MKAQCLFHSVVILSLLAVAFASQPVEAQSAAQDARAAPQAQPSTDLASLLQPDGTLEIPQGTEGSFKVDGWQMALDENGQPHFSQQQATSAIVNPDDSFWSHNFLLGSEVIGSGGAGTIFALAIAGDLVYVGGDFTAVGSVAANNIACWDNYNHQWKALGSGVNNRVYALAVSGTNVYAGGVFNTAGGIKTGPLARWDTFSHTWSTIGILDEDIISPTVYAINVAPNGDVYVGGNFNQVDALSANNIACLTASGWDNLSGGVTGDSAEVRAIGLISGANVFIGGHFTQAGSQIARNLAVWDGVGWNTSGGGVEIPNTNDAEVYTLVVKYEHQVFVGGYFTKTYDYLGESMNVSNVACWTQPGGNSYWSTMAGGLNGEVRAMALAPSDGALYVAGHFTQSMSSATPVRHVARWAVEWQPVEAPGEIYDGVDNNVEALVASDTYLFLGGSFENAGDYIAHHVAGYSISPARWFGLGSSVNAIVTALAISGDGYIYIGGRFSEANGILEAYVARWHIAGNEWSIVGDGVEINGCTGSACIPEVDAILVDKADVYIGGNFTHVGRLAVNGIARFHSTGVYPEYGWHALGPGVTCIFCDARVRAMTLVESKLYVGGDFEHVGLALANNVAVWNGSSWNALFGSSVNGTDGPVYALGPMLNGYLAVGGSFTSPYANLAMWTGSAWAQIGTPVGGPVYAILKGNSEIPLYIGGGFTSPGNHIARLSDAGNAWLVLGSGLNADVNALAPAHDGGIYAGGDFTGHGLINLRYVAHWKYDAWSPLGSGMNNPVYALASSGTRLFAGGVFTSAGGYPSYFFAQWNTGVVFVPVIHR